jgi:hypothetical protein
LRQPHDDREPAVVIRTHRYTVADHGGIGVKRIHRRLFETHHRRVGVELFRDQHRQGGGDALSHFLSRHLHHDRAVGANLYPAGEHRLVLAGLKGVRRRKLVAAAIKAPGADGERAAGHTRRDQKAAAPFVAGLTGLVLGGIHVCLHASGAPCAVAQC